MRNDIRPWDLCLKFQYLPCKHECVAKELCLSLAL